MRDLEPGLITYLRPKLHYGKVGVVVHIRPPAMRDRQRMGEDMRTSQCLIEHVHGQSLTCLAVAGPCRFQ